MGQVLAFKCNAMFGRLLEKFSADDNEGAKMARKLTMALLISWLLTGCIVETTTETVSIDDVYWSAYRDPVGFDSYLDNQTLDPRSSGCFRVHRDIALANEQSKLLECSVILEGSPAWHECHAAFE